MVYQVLNQANKVLAAYETLREVAEDFRRRHATERWDERASYKCERGDDEPLSEAERAELWVEQCERGKEKS